MKRTNNKNNSKAKPEQKERRDKTPKATIFIYRKNNKLMAFLKIIHTKKTYSEAVSADLQQVNRAYYNNNTRYSYRYS